jgi:AcrR family transcriptional regulator
MKKPAAQERSKQSEERCISALHALLATQSFSATTVRQIAERACLSPPAVIKRFTTKTNILLALFEQYCLKVYGVLHTLESATFTDLAELCETLSKEYVALLLADLPANKGMNELYMVDLKVHPLTAGIFRETCRVLEGLAKKTEPDANITTEGTFAASQVLVTTNFNYHLGAMPAFPADDEKRHKLIAQMMVAALTS